MKFRRRSLWLALAACSLLAACSGEAPTTEGMLGEDENAAPPGVSAETVTVGFVLQDVADSGLADYPTLEEQEAFIRRYVESANIQGGLAAHDIEPVFETHVLGDTQEAELELCSRFTEEHKVFAVVLGGMVHRGTRQCYAEARTVMIDSSDYPADQAAFDELSPFLWSTSRSRFDDIVAVIPDSLQLANWFDQDARVGVLVLLSDSNSRMLTPLREELVAVQAELAGRSPSPVSFTISDDNQYVDMSGDAAAVDASVAQAVEGFQADGVTHVVILGGAGLANEFVAAAAGVGYTPRLGITSYDSPGLLEALYADHEASPLEGAVGVSLSPADVNHDFIEEYEGILRAEQTVEEQPSTGLPTDDVGVFETVDVIDGFISSEERDCLVDLGDVEDGGLVERDLEVAVARGQVAPPIHTRLYFESAFHVCDALNFLREATEVIEGDLTAAALADGAAGLGINSQSAATYNVHYEADRFGGADLYRIMVFDDGAGRMEWLLDMMNNLLEFDLG